MWTILVTIGVGGLVISLYKAYNYVFGNCYIFKIPYYRRRHSLVRNFRGCVKAVFSILNRRPRVFRVVGMDCEMTSTSVNGGHPVPAVLQLANPDGYCAIFQLKVMKRAQDKITVPYLSERPKFSVYTLPSENVVGQVLEDPNLLKVGVAVVNDARYLEESYGLFCKGCLDIRFLAKCAGIEPKGLDYLAKKVLGKEKIELSRKYKKPWESDNLTDLQIEYASQDARLGVEIFLKLNQTMIERSYSWLRRLFWDEKTYWKYSLKLWRDYIGKNFEFSTSVNFEQRRSWISYIPSQSPYILKAARQLYTNSSTYCKGAVRYIPFIPESAGFERMCYVCGYPDDGTLSVKLKPLVPVDYSVEFDDDNLYYICLCKECLDESRTKVDYELRHELTEECGAPYPDYEDHQLETAKKLAAELLSSCHDEGKEWIKILESNLYKLLPSLPEEKYHIRTMEIILSMDCWPGSDHGRFVHDYFCLYGGGLKELRWRWCERFWRVMRPQHLPWVWKDFYRSDPRWHWITS